MTKMYRLSRRLPILGHFNAAPNVVRDQHEDNNLLLHARIRSGDYLETLATELDAIAQNLMVDHAPEAAELERLVRELLKANKTFEVRPKQ